MSALTLKDISVLSIKGDSFLTDVSHLILEVNSDGEDVQKADLFSRESSPGVWETGQILTIRDGSTKFMVSVSMEMGNEHQLLAFRELSASVFHGGFGRMYKLPLTQHGDYPSLILRTKPVSVDNVQQSLSRTGQASASSEGYATAREISNSAVDAYQEYERFGKLESLERAIVQFRKAIDMSFEGDSIIPHVSGNLAGCLVRRFERLGNMEDLNDAIRYAEKATSLTSDTNPNKAGFLTNLGSSLMTRFQRLGDFADVDKAIASNQAAIDLTPNGHPNKAIFLSNLGAILSMRFEKRGNADDIHKAVASARMAAELTPDNHPTKPDCLNNMGSTVLVRFRRLGNVADISEAVKASQAAVDLALDGHPKKPGFLSNLGHALAERFQRFGNPADIDNAIVSKQRAVNLTLDGHPKKPYYLNNLGVGLRGRFEWIGNPTDLDNAVESVQRAINLTPEGHPEKPTLLDNLGNSLLTRFELLGNIKDINNALTSKRLAVSLTIDSHPSKPGYLNNLATVLHRRFKQLGDRADIDNAILSSRKAIKLGPSDQPEKAGYLMSLSGFLKTRFHTYGNLPDIDESVSSSQAAVDLMPNDQPDKPSALRTLGNALMIRFFHLQRLEDAQAAISCLSTSATSKVGLPMVRFKSAELWSMVASHIGDPSLLSAYECAINIMPLVAWLGLSIKDRHRHLVEIGGITRNAAAAAISLEQYDRALEWLEQGRSIVWTQILQLRTPVDSLRSVHPKLAERLVQVSRLLDQGSEQDGFSGNEQWSGEEKSRLYRALVLERESIIEKIRSLPNFENFLRPLNLSQLMKSAQDGPVVVVNLAKRRCDALALVPGLEDLVHIPLPDITSERVTMLGNDLKDMLYSSGIRLRGERAAIKIEDEVDEESYKQILAELWNGLVKPVLDSLAFSPEPDTLPRIWWCATGPLAFLPIHAAGIYDSQSMEHQLGSYAISSYIPTISTLLEGHRHAMNSTFKLLSVIQPSAPGTSHLPSTKKELERICSRLTGQTHVILEGEQGTKKRVMKGMQECNWLHLACHGVQRPEDPTKSALIVQDGHLTLEEIIRLDLPNAELAFLSACQTTAGDENLSEEAVHIAGGMLLAGYRGVVATMWSIQDDLAPEVADEFYAHLTRDGQEPDSRKAAEALHVSIQKLRQRRDVPLTAWIPFVHLGV